MAEIKTIEISELEDYTQFIQARQRLVERLTIYKKHQEWALESLENIKKTTDYLVSIQTKHPTWKISTTDKDLIKQVKLTYLLTSPYGMSLR